MKLVPLTPAETQTLLNDVALELRTATDMPYSIVLISDGENLTRIGAQVPSISVMRAILANCIANIDEQTARVTGPTFTIT